MTICHAINWIFVIGIRRTPNHCVQKDVSRRKCLKLVAIVIITLYLEDWIWNVSGSENIEMNCVTLPELVLEKLCKKQDVLSTENQRLLLLNADGSTRIKDIYVLFLETVLKDNWRKLDAMCTINQINLPNIAVGSKWMKNISVLLLKLVLKKHWKLLGATSTKRAGKHYRTVTGSNHIHKDHVQKDVCRRKWLEQDAIKTKRGGLLKDVYGWEETNQQFVQLDVYRSN